MYHLNVCLTLCLCVCVKELYLKLKINFFPLCCQEDEDRRKYIEAIKAEEAKKANKTKDEL